MSMYHDPTPEQLQDILVGVASSARTIDGLVAGTRFASSAEQRAADVLANLRHLEFVAAVPAVAEHFPDRAAVEAAIKKAKDFLA